MSLRHRGEGVLMSLRHRGGEGVLMSLRHRGGGGINEPQTQGGGGGGGINEPYTQGGRGIISRGLDTIHSTYSPPVTRMSSLVLLKARV